MSAFSSGAANCSLSRTRTRYFRKSAECGRWTSMVHWASGESTVGARYVNIGVPFEDGLDDDVSCAMLRHPRSMPMAYQRLFSSMVIEEVIVPPEGGAKNPESVIV